MIVNRKVFQPLSSAPSILKPLLNARRYIYSAITLVLLFSLLIFDSTTATAAPEDQKVYDDYGLFTAEEVADLEDSCRTYGEEGKVDIVIVTTDELDSRTREMYLEDFYDEYAFGYEQEYGTATLLLINMDPSDRGFEIQPYGDAENYIDTYRINHMVDDIKPMLSDGKYYEAMIKFAKETSYYMNQPNLDKEYLDTDVIFFNIFFQLAVALVIGAIVVGIMAIQSGGRITVNNHTYLDEQNSGIIARRDDYIRTTMTRVRKPSNNSGGSSGGGSGVSRGGHSHGGGGSSF